MKKIKIILLILIGFIIGFPSGAWFYSEFLQQTTYVIEKYKPKGGNNNLNNK
jgi:hypothetical protein